MEIINIIYNFREKHPGVPPFFHSTGHLLAIPFLWMPGSPVVSKIKLESQDWVGHIWPPNEKQVRKGSSIHCCWSRDPADLFSADPVAGESRRSLLPHYSHGLRGTAAQDAWSLLSPHVPHFPCWPKNSSYGQQLCQEPSKARDGVSVQNPSSPHLTPSSTCSQTRGDTQEVGAPKMWVRQQNCPLMSPSAALPHTPQLLPQLVPPGHEETWWRGLGMGPRTLCSYSP